MEQTLQNSLAESLAKSETSHLKKYCKFLLKIIKAHSLKIKLSKSPLTKSLSCLTILRSSQSPPLSTSLANSYGFSTLPGF